MRAYWAQGLIGARWRIELFDTVCRKRLEEFSFLVRYAEKDSKNTTRMPLRLSVFWLKTLRDGQKALQIKDLGSSSLCLSLRAKSVPMRVIAHGMQKR